MRLEEAGAGGRLIDSSPGVMSMSRAERNIHLLMLGAMVLTGLSALGGTADGRLSSLLILIGATVVGIVIIIRLYRSRHRQDPE